MVGAKPGATSAVLANTVDPTKPLVLPCITLIVARLRVLSPYLVRYIYPELRFEDDMLPKMATTAKT